MVYQYLNQLFLLLVIILCMETCQCRKRRYKRGDDCNEDVISMYEVSFFGDWSRKAFPKMYPRYRPHAQWSKLVGRTHDSTYKLFRVGELATPTLQKFTEEGNSRMLEFDAQGFNGTLDSFTAAPIRNGVGRTTVRVMANGKYNRISFIVKIVPSPDWFVGIDNVDLCRAGRWRRRIHMTMRPLDGGTDKGLTYTSPNWPTHPQEPVYNILPTKPRHPASPFYNPKQDKVPKIAHVLIERTGEFIRRGKKKATKFQNATNTYIPTDAPTLIKKTSPKPAPNLVEARPPDFEVKVTQQPSSNEYLPPDYGMVTETEQLEQNTPEYKDTMDSTESLTQNDDSAALWSYRDGAYTNEASEELTTDSLIDETESNEIEDDTTDPLVNRRVLQSKSSNDYKPYHKDSHGHNSHRSKVISQKSNHREHPKPQAQKAQGFVEPTEPTVPDFEARSNLRDEYGQQRGILYANEKALEKQEKELILNNGVIKDCLVTQWGSWGPCSKTCGFGVRIRKRQIIQQEENGGTACPRVSVDTLCGSMRTCGWKHFSMFAQHSPRRRRRRRHHYKATDSHAPVHIRYRPGY